MVLTRRQLLETNLAGTYSLIQRQCMCVFSQYWRKSERRQTKLRFTKRATQSNSWD
jgi:hypothetical protein